MLLIIGEGMEMSATVLLPPALQVVSEKSETYPRIKPDEFRHFYVECVEQTLTDLLGVRAREALLDYLARHYGLGRSDLYEHPRELWVLLEESLNKGGIEVEKQIVRRLYSGLLMRGLYSGFLGWEQKENSNFDFVAQVEEVRAHWKTCFTHPVS